MAPDQPPSAAELEDFANGGLSAARRLAVADWLARDAAAAAQAMADRAQTERLAMAMAMDDPLPPAPPGLAAAADRLADAMAQRHRRRHAATPWAAAAACFLLGWAGHAQWQAPGPGAAPAGIAPLAEAAMDARAAAEIAGSLAPLRAPRPGDLSRAAAEVGVQLPRLPPDWTVRGVQVVATPGRPALLVQLEAPGLGDVSLFSRGASDLGPDAPPKAFDMRGAAVAVFERQSSAHVLMDPGGAPEALAQAAGRMVRRLN